MKQEMVIKMYMEGEKSKRKALRAAVSMSGIKSAEWIGEDKTLMKVVGDGVDAVRLVVLLRKKIGNAEVVSVTPEGKKKPKPEPEPGQPVVVYRWAPAPCYPCPCLEAYPKYYPDSSCTIM